MKEYLVCALMPKHQYKMIYSTRFRDHGDSYHRKLLEDIIILENLYPQANILAVDLKNEKVLFHTISSKSVDKPFDFDTYKEYVIADNLKRDEFRHLIDNNVYLNLMQYAEYNPWQIRLKTVNFFMDKLIYVQGSLYAKSYLYSLSKAYPKYIIHLMLDSKIRLSLKDSCIIKDYKNPPYPKDYSAFKYFNILWKMI